MTDKTGPTLTDAKGMGGIIAQDGFDYQVWDALTRLPAWLRNPAFEGIAIEVLEDLEARFFAPHSPRSHLLERFQAKSGTLTRSELIEVLTSFTTFETAHPQAARAQVLVTPALPATLTWIARDPGRVRRARPFYHPFEDIRAASDDKLRADLVAEFGPDLGEFTAQRVEVALRILPDRASAEVSFGAAIHDAFPDHEFGSRQVRGAFIALSDLLAKSRGVMLSRRTLLGVLRAELGVALVNDECLRLHVRSDRHGEERDALEIDASAFCGGNVRYPEPARWHTELLAPLEATARWAGLQGVRRIKLSGSYRLSTAFAVGWAFRSATAFEIDIPTRSGAWATDQHPAPGAALPPWRVSQPKSIQGGRLPVGIGVFRDPTPELLRGMPQANETNVLLATLPQALTTGVEVQSSIQMIKSAVVQAAAAHRPAGIDLYYVGPAAFAVALGHRWNALPVTQLWEFVTAESRYTPTLRLG